MGRPECCPISRLGGHRRPHGELRVVIERTLADWRSYARVMAHLEARGRVTGDAGSAVWAHHRNVARRLAKAVSEGDYAASPVAVRQALIGGKYRALAHLTPVDRIVAGVVADALSRVLEPWWPPTLYSYRRGRSPLHALEAFNQHVREERRMYADPRDRGLFVLRRDVRDYGDSIPVTDDAPLWPLLRGALSEASGHVVDDALWSLLRSVVRPPVLDSDRSVIHPARGVPTGSPVQPMVCNVYLAALDQRLAAMTGGFYARYGDDILFAHRDSAQALEASRLLDDQLTQLGLQVNVTKRRDLFFNGAGRSSPAWLGARGTTAVEYLGCRIAFDGTLGLKRDKQRSLLNDLDERLARTRRLLRDLPVEECGGALCSVVNEMLTPASTLGHPSAESLRRVVSDRQQLAQLDFEIARRVAETLSGRSGVRAFRTISYKRLRHAWRLASLVVARNRT